MSHQIPDEARLGKSPISGPWHAAIKELLSSGLAAETEKVIHTIPEVVVIADSGE